MNNWKKMDYSKLEKDCWYEIGFYSELSKRFYQQGIFKFNDGFKEDGYKIEPFPNYYKKINLTEPSLHETV